jgi:hypothetical protein
MDAQQQAPPGVAFHELASSHKETGGRVSEPTTHTGYCEQAATDADEEFARRLQAKFDAAEFATASRGFALPPPQ